MDSEAYKNALAGNGNKQFLLPSLFTAFGWVCRQQHSKKSVLFILTVPYIIQMAKNWSFKNIYI